MRGSGRSGLLRIGIDARLVGRGLGIGTAVVGLTSALVDRAEVVWFGDEDLAPPGVAEAVRVPAPYPVLDTLVGRKLAARSNVDLVHFMGNTGWLNRGAVPGVLTIQDLIYFDEERSGRTLRQRAGHAYLRFNVRRAIEAADRVTVPSSATGRAVAARFAPDRDPVVIPWGVDPPVHPHRRSEGPAYVVAFAAKDPRKGLGVLLDAWREMPPEGPELWLLAGGGLMPDIEQRLATEPPARTIKVLGYLPRDQLWNVIAGALALVHPATADGFAFPVLEAMSVGVPVIGGLSEAAQELGGEALLQVDPADAPRSIRELARRLASDPDQRDEVAARAKTRAEAFAWHLIADRYMAVYEEAVSARRATTFDSAAQMTS